MVDSHKTWAIVGVVLAVIFLGVLFYAFNSNQEAVAGKAVEADKAEFGIVMEPIIKEIMPVYNPDGSRMTVTIYEANNAGDQIWRGVFQVRGINDGYVIYSVFSKEYSPDSPELSDFICRCKEDACPNYRTCSGEPLEDST